MYASGEIVIGVSRRAGTPPLRVSVTTCCPVHVVEPALEEGALFFNDEEAALTPELLQGGAFYNGAGRMQ